MEVPQVRRGPVLSQRPLFQLQFGKVEDQEKQVPVEHHDLMVEEASPQVKFRCLCEKIVKIQTYFAFLFMVRGLKLQAVYYDGACER